MPVALAVVVALVVALVVYFCVVQSCTIFVVLVDPCVLVSIPNDQSCAPGDVAVPVLLWHPRRYSIKTTTTKKIRSQQRRQVLALPLDVFLCLTAAAQLVVRPS